MNKEFVYRDQKRFEDEHLTDSLMENQADENPTVKKNPLAIDSEVHEYSLPKKDYGVVRDSGLYNEDAINDLLDRHKGTLKKLGFTEVVMDANSSVKGYTGEFFAIKIKATNKQGEWVSGWLVPDVEMKPAGLGRPQEYSTGNLVYTIHLPGVEQALEIMRPGDGYELEWLRGYSESTKVVKSRPAWMYPELFNLPGQEVWPKNSKVAVIGDPFQACDKEGVTMVEYEYADEMVPPVIQLWLEGQNKVRETVENWLESLYRENEFALNKIYGMYTPDSQNPYRAYFEYCEFLTSELVEIMVKGKTLTPELQTKIEEARVLGESLRKGTWRFEDGKKLITTSYEINQYLDPDFNINDLSFFGENTLSTWYEYKESSIKALGDSHIWDEYSQRWSKYLQTIPIDRLKTIIPNWGEKFDQAKYWLKELPTITSPERSSLGRRYLQNFFDEIACYQDEGDEELSHLFDPQIAFIESRGMMSDNVLGFFQPGYPLNHRNRETLSEIFGRVEQAKKYLEFIYPKIKVEKERLDELEVPMSIEMQKKYLSQFEKALAQHAFFHKRTQKAVPIHGFFPHDMPAIDEQDRIVALTSVSMHGWNELGYEGFKKDIAPALQYLKIGGKYILGPINQVVYFGSSYSDFNSQALTDVLKELKNDGLIEYKFVKGVKNSNDTMGGYGEYNEYDPTAGWSKNDQELLANESASSLVITRLK